MKCFLRKIWWSLTRMQSWSGCIVKDTESDVPAYVTHGKCEDCGHIDFHWEKRYVRLSTDNIRPLLVGYAGEIIQHHNEQKGKEVIKSSGGITEKYAQKIIDMVK